MTTHRSFIKHRVEPHVYAIESDEDGVILSALDVTSESTSGGICLHALASLPLAGRIDDVEYLQRTRHDEFDDFVPDCGNVHHLMTDLLGMETEHRRAAAEFAMADSKSKALKKEMEIAGAKVHELLARISDRKPLPLFDAVGV